MRCVDCEGIIWLVREKVMWCLQVFIQCTAAAAHNSMLDTSMSNSMMLSGQLDFSHNYSTLPLGLRPAPNSNLLLTEF